MFSLYEQFVDFLGALTKYVMLVLTAIIFGIIMYAVFTRYVLDFVPSWSEEVPRYLLVWISLLGTALAVDRKDHIGFDYLFNKMPERARRIGALVLNIGIFIMGLIMLAWGIRYTREFGADFMESIPVTNFWLYISMPISGGLILLFLLRDEVRGIFALRQSGR
jgi:TRAP-type C4-dicarboxylate transport system permease small subunit